MSLSPLDERITPIAAICDGSTFLEVINALRGLDGIGQAFVAEIDALESRYFFMLRYIANSDDSSSTAGDRNELRLSLKRLMAKIENSLAAGGNNQRAAYLRFQARRPEESLASICSDYLAELERLHTDTLSLTDTGRRKTLEQLADDIFMRLWADNSLSAEDFALAESLITDSSIPSYDRTLWTAAAALGYRQLSPGARLDLLLKAHSLADNDISTMAALWLVIIMPDIDVADRANITEVMEQQHPGDIYDGICAIIQCLTKVTPRALTADEMRRMSEISARLNEKLRNKPDDADPAEYMASLLNADERELVQRFTTLQLQGDDMFSLSLGQMRHDAFYGRLGNWFLPYHPGHSALAEVVDGEGMALADTLRKVPGLCDSDKYALMLSIARMPDGLRAPALRQMTDQLFAMQQNEDFNEAFEAVSSLPRRLSIGRHARNLKRFVSKFNGAGQIWGGFPPDDALVRVIITVCDDKEREFADMMAKAGLHFSATLLFDTLLDSSDDADIIIAAANNERANNRNHKAIQLFNRALEKLPGELSIIKQLAELYSDEDKFVELHRLLEPYESELAADRSLLALWAKANLDRNNYETAISAYQSLDDKTEEERYSLGLALLLTGDIYGALEQFDTLAAPAGVEEAFYRALPHWFSGNKREALLLLDDMTTDSNFHLLENEVGKFNLIYRSSPLNTDNPVAFDEISLIPDMLKFKKHKGGNSLPIDIF